VMVGVAGCMARQRAMPPIKEVLVKARISAPNCHDGSALRAMN
jgi:hypothetical protein